MVEFVSMTRAQAGEYLARFLAEMPACEQRLADTAAATGGPPAKTLDHTPESLGPLWAWATTQMAWRPGYTPPPLGMPGPRIDPATLEPAESLPSWFHHPSGAGYAEFSAQTLWLIDGLGRYLGNTVVATVPGTRWKAGHARAKGYALQNQPVIAGLGDEISTIEACAALAARALTGGQRTLRDAYDNWASRARHASQRTRRRSTLPGTLRAAHRPGSGCAT